MNEDSLKLDSSFTQEKIQQLSEFIHTISDTKIDIIETRFTKILDLFQEQPELLDPHLSQLIGKCISFLQPFLKREEISDNNNHSISSHPILCEEIIHKVFCVLYFFCKVRGYKTIWKFLPHEASVLPTLFKFLIRMEEQHITSDQSNNSIDSLDNISSQTPWRTIYILLIWIACASLVPFNLTTVGIDILALVSYISSKYLTTSSSVSDAASICITRILIRPDSMKEGILNKFLIWSAKSLNNTTNFEAFETEKSKSRINTAHNQFYIKASLLRTLSQIYKLSPRSTLSKFSVQIWSALNISTSNNSTLLQKLNMKLSQRIALALLRPRIFKWHYHRDAKTLNFNDISDNSKQINKSNDSFYSQITPNTCVSFDNTIDNDNEDSLSDDDTTLEQIIQYLLSGLSSSDTIVRWSAAKGIGRIASRLPSDIADGIVESVFTLFSPLKSHNAWSGACFGLAELTRSGVLLPTRLNKAATYVTKALTFEVLRGTHSIGGNVRDAACYVSWAFARAYDHDALKSIKQILAPILLSVSCLDREVNIRRAAAAALQELFGRLGIFHECVQLSDYFSLGNRQHCFTSIAPQISRKYLEYRDCIIKSLVESKLCHWDPTIRQLASTSLAIIIYQNDSSSSSSSSLFLSIIPILILRTTYTNITQKHGSLLAIESIILECHNHNCLPDINNPIFEKIKLIIENLEKARGYLRKGGDLTRTAVCNLISSLSKSVSNISLSASHIFRYISTIESCLRHPYETVQNSAVNSLRNIIKYRISQPLFFNNHKKQISDILYKFIGYLYNEQNVAVTRSTALSLGALTFLFVNENINAENVTKWLVDLVLSLCSSSIRIPKDKNDRDIETRRNSVIALGEVIENIKLNLFLCIENDILNSIDSNKLYRHHFISLHPHLHHTTLAEVVFQCLVRCTLDCSFDNRGDVGSWIRINALKSLSILTRIALSPEWNLKYIQYSNNEKYKYIISPSEISSRFLSVLSTQLGERLNKNRINAGNILLQFVKMSIDFPCKEPIIKAYELNNSNPDFSSSLTYSHTISLLSQPLLSIHLLAGYITSIGDLTENIRDYSGKALLQYTMSHQYDIACLLYVIGNTKGRVLFLDSLDMSQFNYNISDLLPISVFSRSEKENVININNNNLITTVSSCSNIDIQNSNSILWFRFINSYLRTLAFLLSRGAFDDLLNSDYGKDIFLIPL